MLAALRVVAAQPLCQNVAVAQNLRLSRLPQPLLHKSAAAIVTRLCRGPARGSWLKLLHFFTLQPPQAVWAACLVYKLHKLYQNPIFQHPVLRLCPDIKWFANWMTSIADSFRTLSAEQGSPPSLDPSHEWPRSHGLILAIAAAHLTATGRAVPTAMLHTRHRQHVAHTAQQRTKPRH